MLTENSEDSLLCGKNVIKNKFNIFLYLKIFNVRENLKTEQPLPGPPWSHFHIKTSYLFSSRKGANA